MKLTGLEETPGGELGTSVAISADGNTARRSAASAMKARKRNRWWEPRGCSRERARPGHSRDTKLTGGGRKARVSSASASPFPATETPPWSEESSMTRGKKQFGAAWVFTRSGSTWTQQGEKLTGGGEEENGRFGKSVALSGDGNTALVGGYFDNKGKGAAWVFTRSGESWHAAGSEADGRRRGRRRPVRGQRRTLLRRRHGTDRGAAR